MQKLHFKYEMKIDYTFLVERCNFTIKCFPKDTKRQKISNLSTSLTPPAVYQYGTDGFRNVQIYGGNFIPHDVFVFSIEGDAETALAEYEEEVNDELDMIFSIPYGLNKPGMNIKRFYEKNRPEDSLGDFDKAIYYMHTLFDFMIYEPGVTDTRTNCEEAFSLGKGVCQDYAHIYIALLHLAGFSARYVTGLIVGEGASHAWVEVLIDGKWYGIDPTNNKTVSCEHIKIGIGRDANDCQINRGIMHGGGLHTQTVQVCVQKELAQ